MNDLFEIERQAKMLMTAHGVGSLAFAFDNSKRRLGAMHSLRVNGVHLPKKITISKHYALILPMEEIRNTVLHEIAHALAPGDGHGYRWKAKAREIGAKPERCASPSASPKAPIEGRCPKCDVKVSDHFRRPSRTYIHRTCRTVLIYRKVAS
jgi:phage FluMu protein Com